MRFAYSFWGFTADRKYKNGAEISTPDGNAAYSWSILWEAFRRGWETWLLQEDRDAEYVNGRLTNAFASFSQTKRFAAWRSANKTITTGGIVLNELEDLPHIDIALIEWRWPIPGRNCQVLSQSDYQPDLDRQTEVLKFLKSRGTKIIIWDLDHKLTLADEVRWAPDAIFETSVIPRDLGFKRTHVDFPIVCSELLQWSTLPCSPSRKLVYVGSRYERDDVIDEWIKPVSERFPFQVEFWGNWTRESTLREVRTKWPYILYNDRITMNTFRNVYGTAVACPLLGKKSYLETGFTTPRPYEALMFGCLPIGLSSHVGIENYVLFVARDSKDLGDIVAYLSAMPLKKRDELRRENVEKIKFMDSSNFLDEIERVERRGRNG